MTGLTFCMLGLALILFAVGAPVFLFYFTNWAVDHDPQSLWSAMVGLLLTLAGFAMLVELP